MRDDRHKWAPALGRKYPPINNPHLSISVVNTGRQTLISGPYKKCLEAGKLTQAAGWPKIVTAQHYALRLRRDRILLVNGPALSDGWQEDAGICVSDMSSAYITIEISGECALELLNRGTDLSIDAASASVARNFRGYEVLIYRWQSPTQFRLQCHHGNLQAIWHLLQAFAQQVAAHQPTGESYN